MSRSATVTSQGLAEWVRLGFPKQATETYTSSVIFMKQLTTVAISTITYLANMFPEDNYTSETFKGIEMKILKKNCKDEMAQFVSTSTNQAFEAFEKKYLHKLALCFYDGDCTADNLMEYFIFKYSYSGDVSVTVTSSDREHVVRRAKYTLDNVAQQICQMARACLTAQTCRSTFDIHDVSVRLYYNDDAPDGYQAPGFLASTEEVDHLAGTMAAITKLGTVATPFHQLTAASYIRDNDIVASHEAQPSENTPMFTQNAGDIDRDASSPNNYYRPPVVCPCNKRYSYNEEIMLTCNNCGTLQHAACFGRRAPVARHCCMRCSDGDASRDPTDPSIVKLGQTKRECVCILRRTLSWCSMEQAVCVDSDGLVDKFGLSQVSAAKLLKTLQFYGIIEINATDPMAPCTINKKRLEVVMKKYFILEESAFLDRLLTESQSQDHPDPVGDMLKPMEKVYLLDATLGKIIGPPSQESVMEDLPLKQYKEAMLSNQLSKQMDEDLPMSGSHNPLQDMKMTRKNAGKRKAGKENVAGVKAKRVKVTRK